MSYGDDENRLESKIDLLLKLADADVSSRLVSTVLDNLTVAEKKEFAHRMIAMSDDALQRLVVRTIESNTTRWVAEEVGRVATARWAVFKARIDGVVIERLNLLVTNEYIARIVDAQSPTLVREAILSKIRELLKPLRG